MTDQPRTELRDRIAEALLDHLSRTADIRPGRTGDLAFMPEVTDAERLRIADALAAVLQPPADRAAVLRDAEWIVEHCPEHGCVEPETEVCHCEIADRLRRLAAEAQQQPDTETPTVAPQPVQHAPGTAILCPDCRAKGYSVCLADDPPAAVERSAADDTLHGESVAHIADAVAPHCAGFPTTCPNPIPVPPAPPHHDGGIRCGCYDEETE